MASGDGKQGFGSGYAADFCDPERYLPTGSSAANLAVRQGIMLSVPEFRASRCVRYRFRYSECRRCADACPHDAVTLSDEGISIDHARCQNCALCTSACRTEALVAGNLPRIELLKQAAKQSRFSFACAPSELAGDAIVPCLGALDPAMLAYLAKRGIATELRGSGHCLECPHGAEGALQLELNLEALALLHDANGEAAWAKVSLAAGEAETRRPHNEHRAGRRQLFRRLIGRGMHEVARSAEGTSDFPVPEKAIRAGAPFLTAQRELLQIVCKPAEGERFEVKPHAALPLMGLRIGPGCTACEACFRTCPTGALQIRESDTAWALTFQFDRCVACSVCLEVCQPGVLHEADEFDAAPLRQEVVLHRLRKQRCARCDRFFVSAESAEVCPVCADDEDAFSAIFG